MYSKVIQLCAVLSCIQLFETPMGYSSPTSGSSVHGILQVRILEMVAMPSSRGSSQPRDQTQVSHIAGGFFTSWVTSEAQFSRSDIIYLSFSVWLTSLSMIIYKFIHGAVNGIISFSFITAIRMAIIKKPTYNIEKY